MSDTDRAIPNVLSIAGSDPSGGAGIQADLKTFAALGCHGMAALTALTAQNTTGVSAIHVPPPAFVAAQIDDIFADIAVAAVKVGMLGAPEIVTAVATCLARHPGIPIVVDPVLVATSGATLGDEEVVTALKRHLLTFANVITPNLAEAARLSGLAIADNREAMERTARALHAATPTAWLIKGGHAEGDEADDLLFDGAPHWLSAPRVDTANTHGTGCTLSSAIAAFLARGLAVREAVGAAKAYVSAALAGADALDVGRGPGPVDHFAALRKRS